uniref:Uncharacterized protein n=1 Tax=viral metagenome TaxID=1070528 RepID=A0A6C0H8R2_9ZZZZ
MSSIFSSDIKNATDLPIHLNYDIKDLLKYISDNNKKYLLLSLLKINIKILLYDECNTKHKDINKNINFLINIFLRSFHDSMNIYPKNLNIIHYIIFNKINIYDVLFLVIKIYYMDPCIIIQHDHKNNSMDSWEIYKKVRYSFSDKTEYYVECNKLIHKLCISYDDTNINILFNHDYTDLLFNGSNSSNEISILTDKINNLKIQTEYYKITEECNFNKNKLINDINKNEIINEISILTNIMNNLQIQTDYYYNKINEDIILIKNKIINDINQLNIQNNKLMNEIKSLTENINQSNIQNNYYYNKINMLENNTYILNKILSIIIIIYFLIIFIISIMLFFKYNNIMINEVNEVPNLLLNYIYIDDKPIVRLQLKN